MLINTYEEATALLATYPAFTYAALRAAELAPDDAEATRLRRYADVQRSVFIPAEAAPPAPAAADTEVAPRSPARPCATTATEADEATDAIDAFLSRYPAQAAGTPLMEEPADEPAAEAYEIADEPEIPENPELLARNLIKNRKYAEALAIIEDLNLKNPEKSIYFADQIRFLKKLILNQTKANC